MNKINGLHGKGVYIYENKLNSDLMLPKHTLDGQKMIRPKQSFRGDSYFLEMVRIGQLKLLKCIDNGEAKIMNENKLILDQPDIVKSCGKVEHVQASKPNIPLNDSNQNNKESTQEKVLLTEDPAGSIEVIID